MTYIPGISITGTCTDDTDLDKKASGKRRAMTGTQDNAENEYEGGIIWLAAF